MLAAGSRLGPYEILSSLGAGGMGEVYEARDTRLGRTVAIKVLASHLAESPERRQRFEREARAVSSLNHPHIAALYDVGSEDGTDFLVMECVEGQTLAERLKKGALPLDEVLRYGAQIADALDKAHRRGIVHRDLKPSNVMLTRDGVKILDFGLAKLEEREVGVVVDSSAPTEAKTLTEEGTILGTLQYMAPEQLEGKTVDARADLFALGGILYEMVTGRAPFQGGSQASLIAAILEHDPAPVSTVEPTASPALDHVIGRCLRKDPDERWQAALDVEHGIEWVATSAPTASAPSLSRRRGWLMPMLSAVIAVAAGLFGGWYLASEPPGTDPVIRSRIPVAPGRLAPLEGWPGASASAVAISAGGNHVAYVGERNGTTGIYLKAMNESEARWIDGTEGAGVPFFSPDGRWLGFAREGIWKVPVAGGAPVSISEGGDIRGASWGEDGYVYFARGLSSGLERIPASGGEAEEVTTRDIENREKTHRFPAVLPNGKGVLFTMGSADLETFDEARIDVLDLGSGERRVLIEGGTTPRYVPTGHVVYARAGSLFAVPFDVERLEVTGTPAPVLDGVVTSPHMGPGHFDVSARGLLVYVPGGRRAPKTRLVWVDREGGAEPIPGREHHLRHPRIAPDGARVAVNVDPGNISVWIHELFRGTWTRLASGWDNAQAIWEPNGDYVTFQSNRAGPSNLFRKAVDGSEPAERLTDSEHSQRPYDWSPDGSILVYRHGNDIWALPVQVDRDSFPLLEDNANERAADISPDGRWLAYISDQSGRAEVYVQPFPEPGPRVQISTHGGTEPAWAPSGEELFFREGDRMMVVDVESGQRIEVSRPRYLFNASPYIASPFVRQYDVAPDGRRFLMLEEIELEPMPDHLTLIVNWLDELESRFADE